MIILSGLAKLRADNHSESGLLSPEVRTAQVGGGWRMELLDTGVIDEVRDALGDDAYRGYAGRMLAEMRALERVLSGHLADGSFEALAQSAHRAAGSAVSVGGKGLHAALKRIEDVARTDAAGAALPPLVAAIPALVEETETAITALIGEA